MPTDVTPAPFRYAQQFPIALEHPKIYAKMFGNHTLDGQRSVNMGLHQHDPYAQQASYAQQYPQNPHLQVPQHHHQQVHQGSPSYSHHPPPFLGHPSLPQLAPPSLIVHPIVHDSTPNKCLPNGVRNPYSPYAGETYIPSSEKADRMALDQTGSPFLPVASLRSHHPGTSTAYGGGSHSGSLPIPIPIAARGSVMSHGWAEGSSISNSASHHGGRRVDDGWDGSQGRAHMGHMPDPTSTAGRLGRTPEMGMGLGLHLGGSVGSWRQAPSSWQNHARMTPSMVPPPVSYLAPMGTSGLSRSNPQHAGEQMSRLGRERSGSVDERSRPRRASFVLPGEECPSGSPGSPKAGGLKRSGSGKSQGGSRERRLSIQGQTHSPIVNSPLARIAKLSIEDEGGLRRKRSGSARHSPSGGGT